jgi:hypothetical protein
MCYTRRLIVIAGILAVATLALPSVPAADQKQPSAKGQATQPGPSANPTQGQAKDKWRYKFFNGEWWYWLPSGQWAYWRDNRWNRYGSKPVAASPASGAAATEGTGTAGGAPAFEDTDNGPFYGHSLGSLDTGTQEDDEEDGPLYGHALPTGVVSPWSGGSASGSSYGHAEAYDD